MGRFPDPLVHRSVAILVGIGSLWPLAQPGIGQSSETATRLAVPNQVADAIRARIKSELLDERSRDRFPGWKLARDLGPAAGPVLWQMLRKANGVRHRLLLWGALVQAVGTSDDRALLEYASGCQDREKAFALLCVALGPRRQHSLTDLGLDEGAVPGWLAKKGEPLPIQVAARLALTRFPFAGAGGSGARLALPADWKAEPDLLAAALYSGASPPADLRSLRLWSMDSDDAHLVWRGYLLCPNPGDGNDPVRLARAQEIYELEADSFGHARRCAAYWLTQAPQTREVAEFLSGQVEEEGLGVVLGLDAPTRHALVRRSNRWFLPRPSPLFQNADERGRAAVIYALHETLDVIRAVAHRWGDLRGEDAAIADSVGLALAWRLLRDGIHDREWQELPPGLGQLASAQWMRWALGGATGTGVEVESPRALEPHDGHLAQGLELALAGRLPPEAAQRLLEAALWQRGHHPMMTLRDLHRHLVFDLLLRGERLPSSTTVLPFADDYYHFTQGAVRRPPPGWSLERILDRG